MLRFLRQKPALTYALIGLLGAVFILIVWQDEESGGIESASDLRGPREPDGFIVNAVYSAFDQSGQLSSRIATERAEQFDDEQYALMENPRSAVFEQESGIPWTITAEKGRYDLATELLLLSGDVRVVRTNSGLAPSQLLSESLTLDNLNRIVHTEAPVTLLDYRGTTDAIGMRAWVDERVIEFESQVEGEYVIDNIKQKP